MQMCYYIKHIHLIFRINANCLRNLLLQFSFYFCHLWPGLRNRGCLVRSHKACQCTPSRPDPKLCSRRREHKTEENNSNHDLIWKHRWKFTSILWKEASSFSSNILHLFLGLSFQSQTRKPLEVSWAHFVIYDNWCVWMSVCCLGCVDVINDDLLAI